LGAHTAVSQPVNSDVADASVMVALRVGKPNTPRVLGDATARQQLRPDECILLFGPAMMRCAASATTASQPWQFIAVGQAC